MKKRVDIFSIANFFLSIVDRESGSSITPLKLQKILYYAQGYYLAKENRPLFKEDFEAWAHGPANPGIYDKYKDYGNNAQQRQKYKYQIEAQIRLFGYPVQLVWSISNLSSLCHLPASLYDRAVFIQLSHNSICHQNGDTAGHRLKKRNRRCHTDGSG